MTREIWSATSGDTGRHVVLVHGSLDRSAGLLKLGRRLDEQFVVTRYDRRGYGRSAPHPGPFGIDDQVDDLVGVIASSGGDTAPVVVVGHSYGGNVALATADRHPGLVAGIVTYEPPLSWEAWWPQNSAGGDAVHHQGDPHDAAERFMRRLIGDERWDRLPPSTRAARRSEGPAMVGELSDLRQRPAWRADRIHVPVLALRGEFGHEHHRSGVEALDRMLPDVELGVVAGARHFGPNTHPDDVAARVVEFVSSRMPAG
ncbi:MAG: alpha/beta hydrolase [Ilumatobacteraceae bacterium]